MSGIRSSPFAATLLILCSAAAWMAKAQSPTFANGPPQFTDNPAGIGEADLVMWRIARAQVEGVLGNALPGFTAQRLPATFVSGDTSCTVTLIGPKVALTAAHCVLAKKVGENGRPVMRKLVLGRPELSATARSISCDIPREYLDAPLRLPAVSMAADLALCELDKRPAGIRAETLDFAPNLSSNGSRAMLAGYGCEIVLGDKGALVEKLANPALLRAGMVTLSGTYDGWVTSTSRVGGADAYVCHGDSGGAVYARADPTKPDNAGWAVIGVISGNRRFADGTVVSYLSPLSHPTVAPFIEKWRRNVNPALLNQNRRVCGLDIVGQPALCRN